MARTSFLENIAKDEGIRYSVYSGVTACPELLARITSREIVPSGRISPCFYLRERPRPPFPAAFLSIFGERMDGSLLLDGDNCS